MEAKDKQALLKLIDLIYQTLRNNGGGEAVGIADGADVAEGAKSDVAATNGTSSSSVISLLKGIYILLNTEGATLTSILAAFTGKSTEAKQDSLIGLINPLDKYGVAQIDTTSSSQHYFGFVDKDGNWCIMSEAISGSINTYTYCIGTSSFSTNWTGRAALTYVDFNSAF